MPQHPQQHRQHHQQRQQHHHGGVHGAPTVREYRPSSSGAGGHKSYTACVEPHAPYVPDQRTRRGRSRHRTPSKRTYLLAGISVIIIGLIMYFAGGYLYVAYHKGVFDFINIPVDTNWRIVFQYLGPTLFFVGFFVFIFGFATMCKVIRNPCQSQIDYV